MHVWNYGSDNMNSRQPTRIPDIVIKGDVYRKICAYGDLCNSEISALGSVIIDGDRIIVDDIFLFDQVVTGTSTDISSESISMFICDYIKRGKDPSTLKFWWHSHVNMGVFWSGTDTGTIDRFSSDWMISMVTNKKGELKLRLDLFHPFRMYMDDLPLNVEYDKTFNEAIRKEIDAKVKKQYFPEFREIFTNRPPSMYPADGKITSNNDLPMKDTKTTFNNVSSSDAVVEASPELTTLEVDDMIKNNDITQEQTPFSKQMEKYRSDVDDKVKVDVPLSKSSPLPRYSQKTWLDKVAEIFFGPKK